MRLLHLDKMSLLYTQPFKHTDFNSHVIVESVAAQVLFKRPKYAVRICTHVRKFSKAMQPYRPRCTQGLIQSFYSEITDNPKYFGNR
jgi:hypothetical protein